MANALAFVFQQLMAQTWSACPVKVISCTSSGDLDLAGTVDVQPLVNQVDGSGTATPHGTIYSLQYNRVQGGVSGIIIDPVAGDIGFAVFCDRDISSVVANKAQANPGSARRFNPADGIYVGGILNAVPTRFIRFGDDGLYITDTDQITLTAPTIALDGDVTISGTTVGQGDGTFDGTSVHTHKHSGVTVGASNTGQPV